MYKLKVLHLENKTIKSFVTGSGSCEVISLQYRCNKIFLYIGFPQLVLLYHIPFQSYLDKRELLFFSSENCILLMCHALLTRQMIN